MNAHTKIVAEEAKQPFKVRANLDKPITCFAVRLDALLRVRPFVSTEETRYYLNGVYVHPHPEGGAVCVATDGHRLGVRRDSDGIAPEPQIVTLPKGLKAPASSKVRNPWAVLTRTGERYGHLSLVEGIHDPKHDTAENAIARVDECFQRFGDTIIDGKFPDYPKIIPTDDEKDAVRGFNGEYLASFGKHLTIRGSDAGAPHLIFDHADGDFVGVLMPMRADATRRQDWTKALKAEAA